MTQARRSRTHKRRSWHREISNRSNPIRKFAGRDDGAAFKLFQRQQVFIACDEVGTAGFECCGQNEVIVRIAANPGRRARDRDRNGLPAHKGRQQMRVARMEAEFDPQFFFDLGEDVR